MRLPLRKLFFYLVVLGSALAALVAGILAPDSFRQLAQDISPPITAAPLGTTTQTTRGAGNTVAGGERTVASTSAPPVPPCLLTLEPTIASGARYGLKAGMFAEQVAARTYAAELQKLSLVVKVFQTQDQAGQHWSVVTIGNYGSSEDAAEARAAVAARVGQASEMPVVLLPGQE